MQSARGFVLARAGRVDEARRIRMADWPTEAALAKARLLHAVGNADGASAALEDALDAQLPQVMLIPSNPSLRVIPRSPRVAEFLGALRGDCAPSPAQ